MIYLNNSTISVSSTGVALSLTVIIICTVASLFLNPTVFLYNKKKTSIARLLFCVVSATDFLVCLVYPIVTLYYAATFTFDGVQCQETESGQRQPQNCFSAAKISNIAISLAMMLLTCVVYTTTGVMAVVRAIQIMYPFYPIRKGYVVIVLGFLVVTQSAMFSFVAFSPFGRIMFLPALYIVSNINPFNIFVGSAKFQIIITAIITSSLPIMVQLIAAISTIITAIYLFQQRKVGGLSDLQRGRVAGGIKVLLTNLSSAILILCTIFSFALNGMKEDDSNPTSFPILSEEHGWVLYGFNILFPIISSVWNPVVFICLTPKSRAVLLKSLRELYGRIKTGRYIGPQQVVPS